MTFTQLRNEKRFDAAKQFADVCDRCRKHGLELVAHANTGYEMKRDGQSVGWFFPDHSDSTLATWASVQITRQEEAVSEHH